MKIQTHIRMALPAGKRYTTRIQLDKFVPAQSVGTLVCATVREGRTVVATYAKRGCA